ncbi:hypothetical protein FA09DRAFT_331379 [Tilletiopsis washingtonensis]|uniref:Uncharacterized protein n=1 Tax=Tilletiopsis washingtonensis TaxID=58919 RepID=A0A316Z8G0_9BASI|nr:hypothetical protein FA09DRAFT_331379 [Tilletiopsis washingtonensis]PWN96525.1 hypothetical protein FA09DRAFT_331379 [Tilletiopsis washingtonensis]
MGGQGAARESSTAPGRQPKPRTSARLRCVQADPLPSPLGRGPCTPAHSIERSVMWSVESMSGSRLSGARGSLCCDSSRDPGLACLVQATPMFGCSQVLLIILLSTLSTTLHDPSLHPHLIARGVLIDVHAERDPSCTCRTPSRRAACVRQSPPERRYALCCAPRRSCVHG